jgi:hypothetical protein
MMKVMNFKDYKDEHTPHIVQEVICLYCMHRWIAVRPQGTRLIDLECSLCGTAGNVIATGEDLEVEVE